MDDVDRLAGLLAANDIDAARTAATALEAAHPAAASLARSVIASHASDPPLSKVQLATLYLMANNRERALAVAREALVPGVVPAIRNAVASLFLAAEANQDAKRLLDAVIVESPDDRNAHMNLALASYRIGDLGAAMTSYARAFELEPTDLAPIHAMMEMFAEIGKWVGGLAALDMSRKGEPPADVAVALDLAAIQMLQYVAHDYPRPGVDAGADTTVKDLVRNVTQRAPRVQLVAARALVDIGRMAEATSIVAGLAKNTELTPQERADQHFIEGLLAEHARKATVAVELYGKTISLDRSRADAATNALSLLVAQGTPEALGKIEPLLAQLDPAARSSSPTLAFNEARYHQKAARRDDAIAALRRVLELCEPDDELAEVARRSLAELGAPA